MKYKTVMLNQGYSLQIGVHVHDINNNGYSGRGRIHITDGFMLISEFILSITIIFNFDVKSF